MRVVFFVLLICSVPAVAMSSDDHLMILERRLAEIGEPSSVLQQIEKKCLQESIAEHKAAERTAANRRAEEANAMKKEVKKQMLEAERVSGLTTEQLDAEEKSKSAAANEERKQRAQKAIYWDARRMIDRVFAEGQRVVEKTQCVAAYVRKYQIEKLNDFYFRNQIATCQKFVQYGAVQVNCQTCAGTFTHGNGQYQSVGGGEIVRATLTADDGMVLDMTRTKLRASWPQSGHYIVYDLSDGRVRVTEVNSYITENLVRSYLRPTDKRTYNLNVFFRKVDGLFSETQMPVEDFSRLVFQAEWLEKRLQELGGI